MRMLRVQNVSVCSKATPSPSCLLEEPSHVGLEEVLARCLERLAESPGVLGGLEGLFPGGDRLRLLPACADVLEPRLEPHLVIRRPKADVEGALSPAAVVSM